MNATTSTQWLCGGKKIFPAMLAAIGQARQSIEFEFYIFDDDQTGRRFLDALTQSAQRGVRVRVLVDAFGSLTLVKSFFEPLLKAGGEVCFFNPIRFTRFGVRDHRKLLVCDQQIVFTGGANIADNYDGDGITHGWCDMMIKIENPQLATLLAKEFGHIFSNANFASGRIRRLRAFRRFRRKTDDTQVFIIQPGRGVGSFQRSLQHDLSRAKSADLITPYFLPGRRLRKLLRQIVRRGGRVRLILPALCDVPLARAAGMVFYARLLRAGVEIYEYQPQILHAKLCIVDKKVFAGSSNLDVRSFKMNYEIMLRFTDHATVDGAKEIFSELLKNCRRIESKGFHRAQNCWERWKNHWAHFLVARIDPLVALKHLNQSRPKNGG